MWNAGAPQGQLPPGINAAALQLVVIRLCEQVGMALAAQLGPSGTMRGARQHIVSIPIADVVLHPGLVGYSPSFGHRANGQHLHPPMPPIPSHIGVVYGRAWTEL